MKTTEHICPHCGHPMPSDKIAGRMQGLQRQLYEAVRDAGQLGIGVAALMARLYGHRADGGPSTTNIISVVVMQINRKIKDTGLEIRSTGGEGSFYRLREITDEKRPRRPGRPRHRVDADKASEHSASRASGPEAPDTQLPDRERASGQHHD